MLGLFIAQGGTKESLMVNGFRDSHVGFAQKDFQMRQKALALIKINETKTKW
jgi:hypothetical protein